MFITAQLIRLSPVVTDAWERYCDQNDLDPHRKASNGYRAWYEGVLEEATGKTSTKDLAGARDFGKVLLAFAQAAGDERLIRDLAVDEENRNRWVLRMLAVDLSFLRGEEVGWEYIRGIFGQSKLPPGDFDDCPAEKLLAVVQMMDTQVRRECRRLDIRPCELPRRAAANKSHDAAEHRAAANDHTRRLAALFGLAPAALATWHDALLTQANADLWARRNAAARATHEAQHSVSFDDSTDDAPPF